MEHGSTLREFTTRDLEEQVGHCDNLSDFQREILPHLQDERSAWKEKINSIIAENHYTKDSFARLCEVTRPAVSEWCNGSLPSEREYFIRIGFAAHYNLQEFNFFLQRYGKYPALYPKSLEDSVCIFILNSKTHPHTYQLYLFILSKIENMMKNMQILSLSPSYDTFTMGEELLKVQSEDELIEFIEQNASSYLQKYEKFYSYVQAFIVANNYDNARDKQYSIHSLANTQGWTSSMRQCVSAIRQRKWFPLRRKVIVLGLHLNMTVEQVNQMLSFAQMEPLCAKNPIESAIIYTLNDAELNEQIFCDGGNDLFILARKTLEALDLAGDDLLLNDLECNA